ncbi:hypothetical protein AB0D08_30685 [Kitasatospora sp. NPDC048540]|uniref:hypothetical protein n=1 Tax=Kitasatospora sp. NPDC048540 TaxID=3155634 RepID=UPI0033FFC648
MHYGKSTKTNTPEDVVVKRAEVWVPAREGFKKWQAAQEAAAAKETATVSVSEAG